MRYDGGVTHISLICVGGKAIPPCISVFYPLVGGEMIAVSHTAVIKTHGLSALPYEFIHH